MKYVEYLNTTIKELVADQKRLFIFGQNIAAGSCLSGLTRGLKVGQGSLVVNTPNSENTLCGLGFGSMMAGANAIFFMKQLDFLFLGIDHLVNTYNIVRRKEPQASFTIFPVVVDSGYEGPQACSNNLGDFCSMANIEGFTLNSKSEIQKILKTYLIKPGFRIICPSQRLFKTEMIDCAALDHNDELTIFQYTQGNDATVVCFNLSLPQGLELSRHMQSSGLTADLFCVSAAFAIDWRHILLSIQKTKNLVIIDDSKSVNGPWQGLLNAAAEQCPLQRKVIIRRQLTGYYPRPHADQLEVNYQSIVGQLSSSSKREVNILT